MKMEMYKIIFEITRFFLFLTHVLITIGLQEWGIKEFLDEGINEGPDFLRGTGEGSWERSIFKGTLIFHFLKINRHKFGFGMEYLGGMFLWNRFSFVNEFFCLPSNAFDFSSHVGGIEFMFVYRSSGGPTNIQKFLWSCWSMSKKTSFRYVLYLARIAAVFEVIRKVLEHWLSRRKRYAAWLRTSYRSILHDFSSNTVDFFRNKYDAWKRTGLPSMEDTK